MKSFLLLPLISLAGYTLADDAECREKKADDICNNRVQVSVTDLVYGLKDDLPVEVFQAFAAASAQCLQCVDESDLNALTTSNDSEMSYSECRWYCWCCDFSWCQDSDGNHYCPDQCLDDFAYCADRRRLDESLPPTFMNFEIDVCMDDITPLDSTSTSYTDYNKMLADFETELTQCYADSDAFIDTWSSLCAESGIDLSLLRIDDGSDGSSKIMFGTPGIDMETLTVTTYDSSESHRSSSHTIFYSALGFVAISAFAVVGTAVVVKIMRKRKADRDEQSSKWISEMTNVDIVNPVSS